MEKQDEESESESESEEDGEVLTLFPVSSVFITRISITGQCTPLFKILEVVRSFLAFDF